MKMVLLSGLALAVCLGVQAAAPGLGIPPASTNTFKTNAPLSNPEAAGVIKNDVDKLSYSFGLNMGSQIKNQDIDVNPDVILRGLHDGLEGKTPLMTQQEIQEVQAFFRKELQAKFQAKQAQMREKNKIEGEKFLAENAKKEGVKTMTNGLQYKIIKEGTGPKPKPSDQVKVHYRGTLLNGTEFDSSSKRGPEPATFGVGQVIKGWTEALTNMPVGSKWQLFIPADLAYGANGSGRTIEPNSTLIFDVELVDIATPPPPPQPITSDIIKVPSKAELDAGAKIEVIKPEDLAKYTNKANGGRIGTNAATRATNTTARPAAATK
ncbi:MAG TPA: FKBP-type peptidyl-prolyl cis-trans isomerase [Verrucomicrobiae bacterium]|jgi:FKBP-type peptidyl-prolyl cis-trans isomerase FklB